jgi:ATP adenylyltransferase
MSGSPFDLLWAPWRLDYVTRSASAQGACFLCAGLAANRDRANLIVYRTARSAVVLNRYPYNNGHLLIAPLAHKAGLDDLDEAEVLETQATLARMLSALQRVLKPEGFNIGLNLGKVAGAGLPGHLHWHIVPRWSGDTNFMPVVSGTRVIAQSLEALYDLLRAELAAGPASSAPPTGSS